MKELTEEQKKFLEARIYYGKCGCGWLFTDYPFMSCTKCGKRIVIFVRSGIW